MKLFSPRNSRGVSLVEILVGTSIMLIVFLAMSSMMVNQYRSAESVSQKLAVLDLEKFIILNTVSGDICARQMTTNSADFTFPTASFPPTTPVLLNNLYLSSASAQLLTGVGQPLKGSGNFKIDKISLIDFEGSAGSYVATLNISFIGSIRSLKDLKIKLKLATTIAGSDTVIIGCPGINSMVAGSIPLTNFVPYTTVGGGPHTFTVPPGVSAILVEAWGGGGGGGGSAFYLTNYAGGGGGGGGGGYCKAVISVVPGQIFNITVGAGGTRGLGAGTNSGDFATHGGAGGNSTFDGTRLIAVGGSGGTRTTISAPSSVGNGGNGGGCSTTGTAYQAVGGNGGTAAFNYINATSAIGGSGGSAAGGGGGGGGALASGSIPGGGGGGGSKFDDSNQAYRGGSGAQGQVNVWW